MNARETLKFHLETGSCMEPTQSEWARDYDILAAELADEKAMNIEVSTARVMDLHNFNTRIHAHKEALAWVLKNFNTFAQPPENLRHIVDESCLKAMTADAPVSLLWKQPK